MTATALGKTLTWRITQMKERLTLVSSPEEETPEIDSVTAEVGDRVSFGTWRGVVTLANNYSLNVRWIPSGYETKIARADAEAAGYVFEEGTEGGV